MITIGYQIGLQTLTHIEGDSASIQTIAFVGDSITDFNFLGQTAKFKSFREIGWYNWGLGKLGWPVQPKYNPASLSDGWNIAGVYEFATPGLPCVTIKNTHGPEVVANAADLVFICAGANDLGNLSSSSATAFAAIQDLVNYFRVTNSMRVAVAALTPRAAANNSVGSDGKTFSVRLAETNILLRNWCASINVPFCDWESTLTTGGFWKTNYSYDNVHQSPLGAQVMGDYFASFLATNYKFGLPSLISSAVLTNLGATSDCTSGWLNFVGGAGSSSVLSTVTGDALGDWRRIVHTSANRLTHYQQFYRASIPIPSGAVAGDLLQPIANVRLQAGGDISSFALTCAGSGGMNSWPLRSTAQFAGALGEWEGIFVGPPIVCAAAETFTLTMVFYGSGTVDIRRFGLRKVQSASTPWA